MLSHAEPCAVFKHFKDDLDYVLQTYMPIERILQFFLLAVMRRTHVTSITHSLTGNYTASYRDPDKTLQKCKDTLPPDLLAQLK